MVNAAASICFERWTGMTVKFCNQSIDILIGPIVEQIGVSQLWERSRHGGGLFDGALFDPMAVIRR